MALGGAAMVETAFAQVAPVTPLEQAQFLSWTGLREQKTVGDGSVLTEYQGTTEALNRPGMLLKVSFSPRFSCSPAIALIVPDDTCLLYTSPSPRDGLLSRMPSSA